MDPDWRRIAEEFRRRETVEITKAIEDTGLNVKAFESALNGRPIDDALKTELRSLWHTAAESDAHLLLALYVYARCQRSWELSIEHVPLIARTIDEMYAAWQSVRRPGAGGRQERAAEPLVGTLLEQSVALKDCMAVENACQCSCPVALARHAEAVASRSERLGDDLRALNPDGDADCIEIVHDILRADEITYSGLVDVAGSVLAVLGDEPDALDTLDQAIGTLQRHESDPAILGDARESELRSYRHGLMAMRGYVLDPAIPRLELTEAGFIYVFPFAFDGVSPEQAGEAATRMWGDGHGTAGLAGQVPYYARPSELSDIWYWGHRDRPSYGGVTIVLPALSITTTAGELIEDYRAEIRLNDLGNHYVRIESRRAALNLHQTNQGFRRGSRYMGEEVIHGERGGTWARLRDYADELINDLTLAVGGDADHVVKDVDGDGHVLLEIRAAAATADAGGKRAATREDILQAAGPLISQSVQSLATSLEEWVRYPHPRSPEDVLEGCAFTDSLGVRTNNTTTLFLPGAPNWSWIEYEEVVEFAASVSALFRLWRHQIDREFEQVHAEVKRHSATPQGASTGNEPALADLRLSLGDFMAEVSERRAKLRSDQLVASAVARRFMDNLFSAADIARLESELDVHMAELDALYGRLTTHLDVLQERSTRRYQRFIEFVLAGVTLFSLAELLGLVNDLFFSGKKVQTHGWVEIVVFLMFALTVMTAIALARRRS
ncbi:hypothetical protein [Actinomadura sp. HBU206391]|uniref:hypothetical protein n=1 Tax=Actinomadura sp. HBU206391 TaxID=2731692 RepID=UPI00164F389E|nr:hypothetical protein [Actinomadura sp. HBU206391]MBC6458380.1 hypothetical protein [Actinomadura sp. HBU206391]